jgi:hypothetical protein
MRGSDSALGSNKRASRPLRAAPYRVERNNGRMESNQQESSLVEEDGLQLTRLIVS